ncbi:uncharacterized protein APUU_70994A [Aspergillus puulaauensis]|uniref:Uncharacterized protein n=1 Tax=Aspergillus puulaauensis TaxID=1220207 RepID=A0A7R8ARK2_9EURO|nr:uncharacterized protein APUU_70994A [Aspergillus puulaauensis]BCS29424.1 hypothetical protein APUU_70994A [Aspergillus puulaauensis]
MNRAGFTGCKARSHIPSAHRTGRNVGTDIPLLENDDAGMPPRSLYSSHGTFFEAPRHMMSGNPALFRAIQESQRAPKWNAEAERVKLRRYALHPYVVLEGDKFGNRFEGRGSPMEQDGFHTLSINKTENCDNIRRKGLRSTAFASSNGDAWEDMTREFSAEQRKIGPLGSGEVGETKGGDQVRRAITP